MNIYNFFNSRDIAEHCQNIGHKLTALEIAYIIWLCNSKTIKEKHEAWQYIVDNYPDEELPPPVWTDGNDNLVRTERSLHRFLEHYIKIENDFIESFYDNNGGYIFDFGIRYSFDEDYLCDEIFYDNYKTCFDDMIADIADGEIFGARITKRKLYSSSRPESECDWDTHTIYFNSDMEIIEIDSPIIDDDWAVDDGFGDMCPEIPTPFKIGDLVTYASKNGETTPKYVLAYMPYWERDEKGRDMRYYCNRLKTKGGDLTNMQVSIYDVDENGNIFRDQGLNYLDLEYSRDELSWKERILLALGNYFQKKITLQDFLTAQTIIKAEETARANRVHFGNAEDIKRLAGLSDENENPYQHQFKTKERRELLYKHISDFDDVIKSLNMILLQFNEDIIDIKEEISSMKQKLITSLQNDGIQVFNTSTDNDEQSNHSITEEEHQLAVEMLKKAASELYRVTASIERLADLARISDWDLNLNPELNQINRKIKSTFLSCTLLSENDKRNLEDKYNN